MVKKLSVAKKNRVEAHAPTRSGPVSRLFVGARVLIGALSFSVPPLHVSEESVVETLSKTAPVPLALVPKDCLSPDRHQRRQIVRFSLAVWHC